MKSKFNKHLTKPLHILWDFVPRPLIVATPLNRNGDLVPRLPTMESKQILKLYGTG